MAWAPFGPVPAMTAVTATAASSRPICSRASRGVVGVALTMAIGHACRYETCWPIGHLPLAGTGPMFSPVTMLRQHVDEEGLPPVPVFGLYGVTPEPGPPRPIDCEPPGVFTFEDPAFQSDDIALRCGEVQKRAKTSAIPRNTTRFFEPGNHEPPLTAEMRPDAPLAPF